MHRAVQVNAVNAIAENSAVCRTQPCTNVQFVYLREATQCQINQVPTHAALLTPDTCVQSHAALLPHFKPGLNVRKGANGFVHSGQVWVRVQRILPMDLLVVIDHRKHHAVRKAWLLTSDHEDAVLCSARFVERFQALMEMLTFVQVGGHLFAARCFAECSCPGVSPHLVGIAQRVHFVVLLLVFPIQAVLRHTAACSVPEYNSAFKSTLSRYTRLETHMAHIGRCRWLYAWLTFLFLLQVGAGW
eukprot:TRINITY_DN7114_c0_g1_i4.p1 TRINITY_DN7114_c0_g1~~TRINITY_DN7114_c0_g1_i4.p1  ORF type:complete len:245 (+),score=4.78 TRINITY_DN7114_c0_g1_i4:201-935(+)